MFYRLLYKTHCSTHTCTHSAQTLLLLYKRLLLRQEVTEVLTCMA